MKKKLLLFLIFCSFYNSQLFAQSECTDLTLCAERSFDVSPGQDLMGSMVGNGMSCMGDLNGLFVYYTDASGTVQCSEDYSSGASSVIGDYIVPDGVTEITIVACRMNGGAPNLDCVVLACTPSITCPSDQIDIDCDNTTLSLGAEGFFSGFGGTIDVDCDGIIVYDFTDAFSHPGSCGGSDDVGIAVTIDDVLVETCVFAVEVLPAPAPTITAPTFDANITCAAAAAFTAGDGSYTNSAGDTECLISGAIEADVESVFDECGGSITVTYSIPTADLCPGMTVADVVRTITVDPAPAPTITTNCPASLTCAAAASYTAASASYTNSATDAGCLIEGTLSGSLGTFPGACGGTLTVTYTLAVGSDDNCTDLPITTTCDIEVLPAPAPTITPNCPTAAVACVDAQAADFSIGATYTNNLTGVCAIEGTLDGNFTLPTDACGGSVMVTFTLPTTSVDNCTDVDITETCMITIAPPEIVLDFDIDFGDPCDCSDPLNCNDLLHDILTVTTSPVTSGLDIRIASSMDYFIDVPCAGVGPAGNPSAAIAPTPFVTQITETAIPGTYTLEFWRPQGVIPAVSVSVDGGVAVPIPSADLGPACTCAVEPIPTMSQWGLIIFGLLILNLGLVFLYRKESILEERKRLA